MKIFSQRLIYYKPAKELFGFLNDSDISIVLSTSGTTGDAKFLPLTVYPAVGGFH
jgi:phenylacetate-coenzyme A ligase PaaK-like adenylate-forming protein